MLKSQSWLPGMTATQMVASVAVASVVATSSSRPEASSRSDSGSSPVVVGGEHLTMNHRAGRPTSATLLGGVEMF